MSSHSMGCCIGSQASVGIADIGQMEVLWSLDRADPTNRPGPSVGACDVCGQPAVLTVDEEHEFCGVCAYRVRLSDVTRTRLFRLAVG